MVGRAGRTRTRSADLPARSGTSAVAMTVSEVFHMIWADFPASGAAYSVFLRLAGCLGFAERGWPEKMAKCVAR